MRSRWVALVMLIALWPCATARAVTRLAVLAPNEPAGKHIAAFVEAKLTTVDGVQLLDRESLRDVLVEQQLQACFAPGGASSRVKLGQLLRADLLVMLRSAVPPGKHVDLVICESAQGLRLLVEPIPISTNTEADTAKVVGRITATLERLKHPITGVVAVPPLVCDDFSFNHARDGTAYARLIEQCLLGQPGFVVVEMEEAQGIATELAVAGERAARRPLPLSLHGSYRNTGLGDARRVRVTLQLKQGLRTLVEISADDVVPTQVAARLLDLTRQIMAARGDTTFAKPDAELDSRLLHTRGSLFQRLGQPDEALALCDASLLLKDDPTTHADAAWAISQIWIRERDLRAPRVNGAQNAAAEARVWAENLWMLQAGLDHVESYLSMTKARRPADFSSIRLISILPPEQASDMLLRVMRRKHDAGVVDDTFEFASDIQWAKLSDPAEQYRRVTALAELIVSPRDSSRAIICIFWMFNQGKNVPALHTAVAHLAGSSNPLARKAGLVMLDRLGKGLTILGDEVPGATTMDPLAEPTTRPALVSSSMTVGSSVRIISLTDSLGFEGISGCIPVAPDMDVIWRQQGSIGEPLPASVYVLKGTSKPKLVARAAESAQPVFDGKYLWVAGAGTAGAEIRIIDLATNEEQVLSPEHGLPAERIVAFQGVAIAPGKICAAAQVFHEGATRTWIGMLSLDRSKGRKFIPLHTARLSGLEPFKATDAAVEFMPYFAAITRPTSGKAAGPPCEAIFYGGNRLFSLVFPNITSVETGEGLIVTARAKGLRERSLNQAWDTYGGEQFWIESGGEPASLWRKRMGTAAQDAGWAPEGALAVTDAGIYVFSYDRQVVYTAEKIGQSFVSHPLSPATLAGAGRAIWWRSNHFGMVLVIGNTAFRFEDTAGKGLPWVRR